jgi:hypothetical protein
MVISRVLQHMCFNQAHWFKSLAQQQLVSQLMDCLGASSYSYCSIQILISKSPLNLLGPFDVLLAFIKLQQQESTIISGVILILENTHQVYKYTY